MNSSIYKSVDHVVIRLLEAEPLHELFSDLFGLPVSWPLQREAFATYGWVSVGNTNLEFWAAASNADLPPECQPPLVHGFALDPAHLGSSVTQLADLGISCKEPRAFESQNAQGIEVTNFTNSVVLDVSSNSCCVFFCEWDANGSIFPWKEKLTPVQRKAKEQAAVLRCAGGSLGIIGLFEIELAVTDLDTATEKWQTLTGSSSDPITLTPDIQLRLVRGEQHRVRSLTFAVRSLAQAKAFLVARQLLETSDSKELMILRHRTAGLFFRLVQA